MTSSLFSSRERRILRILLVITLITRLGLAFRSEMRICSRPFNDDSFYLFTVSDHLAHGHGLSVDGVHLTNGIQPLVTFLYAPCFMLAGSDKLLGLRLCFIIVALCDCLSVLFIAKLLRRLQKNPDAEESPLYLRPPIVAAFLWTFLYPILTHTANGLETGLYSALLLISAYTYVTITKQDSPSITSWIGFGIILGLTVLARIDAVFFVTAFCICEVLTAKKKGLFNAVVFGLMAVIITLPWWIYNYKLFGSIMPQSGISEAMEEVTLLNISRMAISLGDLISVFLFLPNYDVPMWVDYVWFVAVLSLALYLIDRFSLISYLRSSINYTALIPLAIASIGLCIYYVFFFGAPHFIPRYVQPLRITWLILVAAAAPVLIQALLGWYRSPKGMGKVVVVLIALGAIGFSGSRYLYYYVLRESNDLYKMVVWVREHPNDLIGMEQTGLTGFWSEKVVNLDGKVNFDALAARKKADIGSYVVARNFEYIADWENLSLPIVESAEKHGATFERIDSVGKVIIFKRIRN